MVKDLFDIRDGYSVGEYRSKTVVPRKVSENHIFDADLSINENKRMVAEHNSNVDALRAKEQEERIELRKKMENEIVEYIMHTYHFSEARARLIMNKAFSETDHKEEEEAFELIEKWCDLIEEFNEITD